MIKNEELINKVNNVYLNLRSNENSRISYLQDKLYSNSEYVSVANEIGKTKLLISKAKANVISDDVNLLVKKLETLNEKKRKIIDNIGINKDFLKPVYKCEKCRDTGFVGGDRCECFFRYLKSVTLETLGIEETINVNYETIPNGLENHYALSNDFINNFNDAKVKNLVFLGKVGTGKTVLAKQISNKLSNENYSTVFLTSTELNLIFLKLHLGEIDRSIVNDILTTCDLLVIDDLGTEPIYRNVTVEYLLSLLSTRLNKNKKFVITTNLAPNEILNKYTERLYSRLSDKTKTRIVPFTINDLRLK